MSQDIIVNMDDLANAPSTQTINSSVRSLRALKIDTQRAFTPHPDTVQDIKGAPILSGVTEVVCDDSGLITQLNFLNPKDSADKYAKQTYPVNDGVLILPGKDETQVSEINSVVDSVIGKKDTVSIAEFDKVLKKMQAYYAKKGESADIYKSNTSQLDPAKHIKVGENCYQKVAKAESAIIVDVPVGKTVGFEGSVSKHGHMAGAQYSSGTFVVAIGTDAKTGEPYARKLDMDYAKQNLRDASTGKPLDFDNLPKISLEEILAKRFPGAQSKRSVYIPRDVEMQNKIRETAVKWVDRAAKTEDGLGMHKR